MKFTTLFILLGLVAVSYSYVFKTSNGILVLTDDEVDIARRSWRRVLVNFDQGCKWCLIFRPYYIDANKDVKAQGWNVRLGQLDMKVYKAQKAKYNIEHHPTQLLFVRNDPKSPYKYTGTKNKVKLLAWLQNRLNLATAAGY